MAGQREKSSVYFMDRYRLDGHVAVVTGGGRGIGAGIARAFAQMGASVVVAARRTHEIEAVAGEIEDAGGSALAVTTDVTDEAALDNLAQSAVNRFGKLTDWINNAGGSTMRMPAQDLPRQEWHRTIALNLTAVYTGSLIVRKYMERGSIINITSGAGHRPGSGQRPLRRRQGRHQFAHLDTGGRVCAGRSRQRGSPGCDTHRGHARSGGQDGRPAG